MVGYVENRARIIRFGECEFGSVENQDDRRRHNRNAGIVRRDTAAVRRGSRALWKVSYHFLFAGIGNSVTISLAGIGIALSHKPFK